MPSFSERHGYEPADLPIKYREDASSNLREMVVSIAEAHGHTPHSIRTVLCDLLFVAPDPDNWSAYPNIDSECRQLLSNCAWYEVYDAIEALWSSTVFAHDHPRRAMFEKDINRLFVKDGAGWQLSNGQIVARGSEPFNNIAGTVTAALAGSQSRTAASEIHEALRDISRRPAADRTGAVHHAMAAIECMTRSLSGDAKSTLGEIVKSKVKAHGIPAPLDEAVAKLWGYSSERGRHVREGGEPSFEEAELVVTVAAAICVYLTRKVA